jgi:hypothetical protein
VRLTVLIVALLGPLAVFGQKTDKELDSRKQSVIEQRIEFLAETLESEDLDYTTIFEDLSWYFEHPINLNSADEEMLRRLYLLSEPQIAALLEYRRKYREMLSVYELGLVRGLDPETIQMILPFIKIEPSGQKDKLDFKKVFKYGRHDIFLRYQRTVEEQEGFSAIDDSTLLANPNKRYLGNPDRYYFRYRFRYSDRISAGLTAEKDPGEEFFTGTQKAGFDFYSAHVFYRGKTVLRQLALGDFQVEFGQGLTAWSGLAFGKSAMINTSRRSGQGLRPSSSAQETLFMRGAGATLQFGKFSATVFGSYKNIDANVVEDTTLSEDADVTVSSFQNTGFHRTVSELADKGSIGELHTGGHVSWNMEHVKVGATAVYSQYQGNLMRDLDTYSQFDFNASSAFNAGVDYNAILGHFHLFGETAISGSTGAIANLHGLQLQADGRLKLMALFRDYPRDYQATLANALSEGSRPQNETGLLMGAEAGLNRYLTLSGYVDHFWSNWMRFRVDGPSSGTDALAQLNFSPSRRTQAYFRVRYKLKQINAPETTEGINPLADQTKLNIRLHAAFQVSDQVKLRSRVEFVQFQVEGSDAEPGVLLYQDVSWQLPKAPLSFSARFAIFQADDYDARLYAYENDVLYAFSIPAYYYRGSRMYLMVNYEPTDFLELWFRIGQWYYDDRTEIGSDLSTIQGRTKTEVKIQARIRF